MTPQAAAAVPDSSLIDNAIIQRLGSDPDLLALMPNGVYYMVAPQSAQRYVTVALDEHEDVAEFRRRAQEEARYRVVAVGLSVAHPDMSAAAYRIDQLLEDVPLPVAGFVWATLHRVQRVRVTTPDLTTPSLRWHTRGGLYRAVFATGHPA